MAPTVVTNPAFGNGGGLVGMHFFNPDEASDKVSPNSQVDLAGMYSDTDGCFGGLFAKTFWDRDTWRLTGGIAAGQVLATRAYTRLTPSNTPYAGLGLRITLNQANRMNLRFEYAWGDDDEEGRYVGMGEAF